jgi:hypothetical protein
MENRRSEPRHRRLKGGRIVFASGHAGQSVLTCTVRDISAHGARLQLGEAHLAPEEFLVSVPGEIEDRPARRVWIHKNEVGVRFIR